MKIEVKAACQQDIETVSVVLSGIQTHDKIGVCNSLTPQKLDANSTVAKSKAFRRL